MAVLCQHRNSPVRVGCQVVIIYAVTHGWLDAVAVADVPAYEERLYELLEQKYDDLLTRFEQGYYEDEDIAQMENALREMAR